MQEANICWSVADLCWYLEIFLLLLLSVVVFQILLFYLFSCFVTSSFRNSILCSALTSVKGVVFTLSLWLLNACKCVWIPYQWVSHPQPPLLVLRDEDKSFFFTVSSRLCLVKTCQFSEFEQSDSRSWRGQTSEVWETIWRQSASSDEHQQWLLMRLARVDTYKHSSDHTFSW